MSRKVNWWGIEEENRVSHFVNLEGEFVQIFDSLRRGDIPETTGAKAETPDLRELLIEYGEHRVRTEFSIDQAVIKIYAIRFNLDKLLNMYIEQISGLVRPMGMRYGGDPCQYLRNVSAMEVSLDIRDQVSQIGEMGKRICELRSSLDEFIRNRSAEAFPNLYALAGELSIDLLYHAGGLRRMAMMPAATIQTLGAEKALFRHTSYGAKPPKHGVLFRYPGLTSLPSSRRGKVARIIANKAAICARADLHGSIIDVEEFRKKIEKEIKSP